MPVMVLKNDVGQDAIVADIDEHPLDTSDRCISVVRDEGPRALKVNAHSCTLSST